MRGRPGTSDSWRTIQGGYEVLAWYEGPPWRDKAGRLRRRLRVKFWHHIVWEKAHGPIPKGHLIHHVDGNPLNNAEDNLECLTIGAHTRLHQRGRSEQKFRDDQRYCGRCRTWKTLEEFGRNTRAIRGVSAACRACRGAYQRLHYRRTHPVPPPRPPRVVDGRKRCAACREWLPLDAFTTHRGAPGDRAKYCRPCTNEKWRAWYQRHRRA